MIKTEKQYIKACKELEKMGDLLLIKATKKQIVEFEKLSDEIIEYQEIHYPIDNEIDEVKMFNSKEFKKLFIKEIEKSTWNKGLPKIYMNNKGQIVKHYKNGKIEIIKKKK